jgi:hypothetical protein
MVGVRTRRWDKENDMVTKRRKRNLAIAAGLYLGFATTTAQAAPPRAPAVDWSGRMLAAARLWLGDLAGAATAPERGKSTEAAGSGVAGIFKLKQHVDNPGQTPMKDGGE